MSTHLLQTKQQALAFVEENGECVLFPLEGYPNLFSRVAGATVEERRNKAWHWSDELHLEKQLFSSLAIKGRVTLTSWARFVVVYPERDSGALRPGEDKLLELIRMHGAMLTPELRREAGMTEVRFERVLQGLRRSMRLAVVEIRQETRTKYVYRYDLTERWVPERYLSG